jgi:methylisocitrate lyase
LLDEDGIIVAPNCYDRFTARIAEDVGFRCINIGGYVVGAATTLTEPLLTLTDMVDVCTQIQSAVDIPVFADAGAGYGEAIQVWNATRQLEASGICGIHIEDQVYPKRAHYHRDYREHVISMEHMMEKLQAALEARRNPEFNICVRTDAFRTDGYDEGVRRANAYAAAGADSIMIFPNTYDEAARAPGDISVPVITSISHGNRVGRPVLTVAELQDMGYKMTTYSTAVLVSAYEAVHRTLSTLRATGDAGISGERAIAARKAIEDLIGLPHLYAMEERTTERATARSAS